MGLIILHVFCYIFPIPHASPYRFIAILKFLLGRGREKGAGRVDDEAEGLRGIQGAHHPGGDARDEEEDAQRLLLLVGRRHGLLRTLIQQQESWRKQICQHFCFRFRRGKRIIFLFISLVIQRNLFLMNNFRSQPWLSSCHF